MEQMPNGAGTRIPRWREGGAQPEQPEWPERGLGQHEAPLPQDLTGALGRLAADYAVELRSLLLAAHVKVLSEMSSERTVTTVWRAGGEAFTCSLAVANGSWRDLIATVAGPVGTAEPQETACETVLDLTSVHQEPSGRPQPAPDIVAPDGPRLAPETVLHAAWVGAGRDLRLRLRYRRDVITAGYARRVAGYHQAALRLMTADPNALHHVQSLLSEEELCTQVHTLAGPRRPLPDRLFVELFEEQARLRPGDVAVVHGTRRWTYRELNARANQIARFLLLRGAGSEDVVAVAMDRTLDWAAATLGVLKAGAVYLPLRPDYPADRVAAQLERAECRFAVTEPTSAQTLHEAYRRLTGACTILHVAEAYQSRAATGNPAVAIRPDQLAYMYFTSGSTGSPKGAMCEHAGMLNHLLAKIEDMRLGAGDVVTQTASQCFDISLWQLVAPLLVGGCSTIVDTATQLDVDRFIDHLSSGDVHVAQLVPSYLDVMLSHLERHPRPLGNLRSVSVTGEALKAELARRWLHLHPGIPLVNAYGATELSDDTMHEVVSEPPAGGIVSVGRPLRNVDTYVLNESLQIVPLGSPGEIAFGGVCVGRGYVNDPERTREAFVDDPYRSGSRLYRTGDFGRWLPDGRMEFLGRRDEQVKVRGFRIEMGEVENALLQMPGVEQAAVLVQGQSDQSRSLVAFFTGSDELGAASLRGFLSASLPDYMVPVRFHRLDALPLTENGKVDKRLLSDLAATRSREAVAWCPPATESERRVAAAWAEVLGVQTDRISRHDDFFQLGGTSLAAVRLMVKLDGLLTLRHLEVSPVLGDLAALIDNGNGIGAPDSHDRGGNGGPPSPPSDASTTVAPAAAGVHRV